jgi:hypothetical protein
MRRSHSLRNYFNFCELRAWAALRANMARAMRSLLIPLVLVFMIAAGEAQPQDAAGRPDALSLEAKVKLSQLITKQSEPLTSSSYSIAMDAVVPAEIEVHPLPSRAEQVAPQLRGYGYVVVEEQIALVEPRSRKIEIVFPRWREP